jgi:hypothetical protein
MGENPIKQARARLGLSRTDLALKLGVTYYRVAAVELGHPQSIPQGWRAGCDALGLDHSALQVEYQAWRQSYAAHAGSSEVAQ